MHINKSYAVRKKKKMIIFSQLVYSPPLQRQKWGQVQSLPHVDWGSHFFDLFCKYQFIRDDLFH